MNQEPERPARLACKSVSRADALRRRWHRLCDIHLPVSLDGSIWRLNRHGRKDEPTQGWKLHVTATILDACDVLQTIAPVLDSFDVQYKAPNSLDELLKINSGLQYGYHQVGKFVTIYPHSGTLAVKLAKTVHCLTAAFAKISVPFDNQYRPGSTVFYRYGGFARVEAADVHATTFLAIKDAEGNDVPDDRFLVKPDWIIDIFPNKTRSMENAFMGTPLGTKYRIFGAIRQRGKGGTYRAVDLTEGEPRLCVVKEGRRHGEVAWNGHDGHALAKNEYCVLREIKTKYDDVPSVRDCFEVKGNFYFAMEYIEGKSLKQLMDARRRRYSIKQILRFAVAIGAIIKSIHDAGWIWNDCKPANLIMTTKKNLRPIDFEGAYRINSRDPFEWRTKAFSHLAFDSTQGPQADIYAFGALLYFLITGQLFNPEVPVEIKKLRHSVPQQLVEIVENLLSDHPPSLEQTLERLEERFGRRVRDLRTA